MILSDRDIKKFYYNRDIEINPVPKDDQIGACSIDLLLGTEFMVFKHTELSSIDLGSDNTNIENCMEKITVPAEGRFALHPGEFALATTLESITLPDNIVGRIDGRSSLGRLGLIIHGTASIFDPGFSGQATLELSNIGKLPLLLKPYMKICAFVFEQLSTPAEIPYYAKKGAKYKSQKGVVASRVNLDNI